MKKQKQIVFVLAGAMGMSIFSGCSPKTEMLNQIQQQVEDKKQDAANQTPVFGFEKNDNEALLNDEQEQAIAQAQDTENEKLKAEYGIPQQILHVEEAERDYLTGDGYGFNHDVIWVNDTLVNTKGKAVYTLKYGEYNIEGFPKTDASSIVEVQDGLTYFRLKPYDQPNLTVDLVVDQNGEEVIRLVSGEKEKYHIIGYGDGCFVVLYNKMNRDAFGSYIYTIDSNGKTITSAKHIENVDTSYSDDYFCSAQYLGEDVFQITGQQTTLYYQAKEGAVTRFSDASNVKPQGIFNNGKLILSDGNALMMADSDDFKTDHINYQLTESLPKLPDSFQFTSYVNGKIFGTIEVLEGDYMTYPVAYKTEGTELDWFSAYRQYRDLMAVPYEDGHTVVTFTGADNCTYLTVLDDDGKELYSPIEVCKQKSFNETNIAQQNGYVQYTDDDDQMRFVYPDSSIHKWDENLKAMKDLNFGAVGDGYLVVGSVETGYEEWNQAEDGYYKFRSLKKRDWFTFEYTKKTKTPDLTNLKMAKAPVIEDADVTQDKSIDQQLDAEINGAEIFNKDGVVLTMTSENTIRLDNNNEDNKIVTVNVTNVAFNGICVSTGFDSLDAKSGDSDEMYIADSYSEYAMYMADISKALAEVPIQEITIQYSVQIGSDAEPVLYFNTIQMDNYDADKLNAFYGDKIGDYTTDDGASISAYRIQTDTGIGVIVKNNDKVKNLYLPGQPRWFINGTDESEGTYNFNFDTILPDSGVIYCFNETADSVRKRLEISNQTDIDLSLNFSASEDSPIGGTLISIPVGVIE